MDLVEKEYVKDFAQDVLNLILANDVEGAKRILENEVKELSKNEKLPSDRKSDK